jgi:hypothetical protein
MEGPDLNRGGGKGEKVQRNLACVLPVLLGFL